MRVRDGWHVDAPLCAALAALGLLGLVVLYSAGGEGWGMPARQGLRLVLGFAVMVLVGRIAPATLMRWSPYLFVAAFALLAAVPVFGVAGKGAQRWLDLGILRFQPAELMKLAVPMVAAWWIARRPLPPTFKRLVGAVLLVLIPVYFVVRQPDLGTAVLIALSGFVVIFLAGIRWRTMLALGAAAAAAAPVFWMYIHEYQRRRILTLFDPWDDPLGAGYHTIQSTIAVGSGGFFGKGWLNGSQSQLEFIPERATDFVFAVYAEEFGLLGALVLLALYLFIVGRSLYIAGCAKDSYSRLLAGALAFTFFCYVFVNVGMVSGILPVVGVPLPLISYGGTSIVTLMAGFGMLMSIHAQRRLITH